METTDWAEQEGGCGVQLSSHHAAHGRPVTLL